MRKLTLLILLALGSARLNAATWTINGSNTMYPLNVKLSSIYQQSHAMTVLRVVSRLIVWRLPSRSLDVGSKPRR